MTPGSLDLVAYRWTPFVRTIAFEGLDFTDGVFAMELRQYRDQPGAALVTLATAAANAEGLSVSVATVEGLTTSTVQIRINETTLEGILPFPASGIEQGASVELVWDLHVTVTGQPKTRWLQGEFTIEPGATH